jgi:four helix bundle protein
MRNEGEFDHDRLDAYRLARAANRDLNHLLDCLPRGNAGLIDQLRRASLSIVLNIAEGSGEFAPLEKARFYRIARRSVDECVAVLDHTVDRGLLAPDEVRPARIMYWRTVAALIRLIQSVESRTRESDPRRTWTDGRRSNSSG